MSEASRSGTTEVANTVLPHCAHCLMFYSRRCSPHTVTLLDYVQFHFSLQVNRVVSWMWSLEKSLPSKCKCYSLKSAVRSTDNANTKMSNQLALQLTAAHDRHVENRLSQKMESLTFALTGCSNSVIRKTANQTKPAISGETERKEQKNRPELREVKETDNVSITEMTWSFNELQKHRSLLTLPGEVFLSLFSLRLSVCLVIDGASPRVCASSFTTLAIELDQRPASGSNVDRPNSPSGDSRKEGAITVYNDLPCWK